MDNCYSNVLIKANLRLLPVVILLTFLILFDHSAAHPDGEMQPYFMNDLVMYLDFEEGEGHIAFDQSSNHNDAGLMCTGENCSPPKWVEGKVGYAIEFDGKDDYAVIHHSQNLIPDELTIALWVNLNVHKTGNIQVLARKRGPGKGLGKGWSIRDRGDGAYQILFYNNETYTAMLRTTTSSNEWVHLTVTYKGSVAKLYKNGKVAAVDKDTALVHSNRNLYLGSHTGKGWFLNGILDEVQVYNSALTESEISTLYNHGK